MWFIYLVEQFIKVNKNLTEFDLRKFLSSESEQLEWKSEGLPSDQLSIENALIVLQVSLFKLTKSYLINSFYH